jgi:hypothetical protein
VTARGLVQALGRLHVLSVQPARLAFQVAARRPEVAQSRRLRAILTANADTAYGRAHGFARVTSLADFRRRVPLVRYDDLAPWIARVADGEAGALTREPVLAFERSGGSTAPTKWIPCTAGLLAEFGAATGAWLADLHRALPTLRDGRSYWSVSPVAQARQITRGGVRVGFDDDTEYFDPLTRWALQHLLAVPGSVARLADLDAWRRATCRALLEADDLVLVSVWSPTFLTRLMQAMERDLPALLPTLPPPRAAAVQRAVDAEGRVTARALWPRLAVVSCWADGVSADYVGELSRWFLGVPIQPKGLLATEGVVSFPRWGERGAVLAVTSHHLDFLDVNGAMRPVSAHELRIGGQYSPVLTTSGGLYRYHLPDVVTCVGRTDGVPRVVFEGKLDRVSDVAGEKLNARHVEAAADVARRATGLQWRFALLAPSRREPPAYTWFVEADADDEVLERARDVLEQGLTESHAYRYARQLGQLGPLVVRRVQGGLAAYERRVVALGQRLGDAKPTLLDARFGWDDAFDGGTP